MKKEGLLSVAAGARVRAGGERREIRQPVDLIRGCVVGVRPSSAPADHFGPDRLPLGGGE